jgi:hypothetical protein
MSGLATFCDTLNKEMNNDRGQRKEVYYAAPAHHKKKQSKHFIPSSGHRHEL